MLRWPFIDADQRDFAVASPSGPHQTPIDQPSTQTIFTGTSGNNTVHGTSSADVFNMFQGGDDTVFGNGGNDEFHFGASFTANDMVRGGAGEDILFLSGGAYSAGLTITSAMLQNVEQIHLTTSNNFKFIMASGLITANPVLSVDASVLDAAHHLTLDASALSQTMQALGGQGDDTLIGGSGDDLFNSFATGTGGTDKMYGGAGSDHLRFAGDFTAADHVDGGADFDALILAGDYSAGLALGATTLVSIETINLGGIGDTHDYSLTMADANVAAGADMFIVAAGIDGGHGLIFNGAAETNGHFIFTDSPGNDSLTGGALSDEFSFSNGGNDAAYGGAGDDLFNLGVTFGSLDSIHGGSGVDSIELFGSDYALTITGSMIEGIEKINFDEHHNFSFMMTDGAVGAGDTLSIGGVVLDSSHTLVVDGSAETNGSFVFFGGLAGDTLTGGALADNLRGGAGADILTGGGGDDVFEYIGGASDSTSTHFDTINHFDADDDLFSGLGSLTGIDHKVAAGALSLASFDSDLAAAIGSGQLGIDHAVLFTPDSGDLAGDTFLIVELNGTAGYQASQDLVIKLDHPSHINHLSLTNFGL